MKINRAALAATLLAGTATLLVDTVPASAQVLDSLRNRQRNQQQQEQPEENQQRRGQTRIGDLSAEESAAILPLYTAVQASDWTAAAGAVAGARAGATTPAARYLVGQLMFNLARGSNNTQMQNEAVDLMLASGAAPADALPALLATQVNAAIAANNFAAAEAGLTRLVEMTPNDTNLVLQLAQVKTRLNKTAEANALQERALQLSQAGGQKAPEALYQRVLASAYQARQAPQAMEAARKLLENYPSASNWRDSLVIFRELGGAGNDLDTYRLMRAARALNGEADYVRYADEANKAAAFGEVKAVLDEAMAGNTITAANRGFAQEMLATANRRMSEDRASLPRERTTVLAGRDGRAALRLADSYFGYGQYREAAELYRAAVEKGADANLANLRLGAALALAGQRAEAETALRAVTGPRAGLANFWMLWLSQRG